MPQSKCVTGIRIQRIDTTDTIQISIWILITTDSDDSENEAVTPEPYLDYSSDEEVTFPQHQTQQESTVTCDICMDREPDVLIVPCGHQNMCGPCAHQEKELRGKCPYDMKLIQQIIPKIPM